MISSEIRYIEGLNFAYGILANIGKEEKNMKIDLSFRCIADLQKFNGTLTGCLAAQDGRTLNR